MLARMQRNWVSRTLVVGTSSGTAPGKQSGTFQSNETCTYATAISRALGHLSPGNEGHLSHKKLNAMGPRSSSLNTPTGNNPDILQWVNG